MKQKFTLLFFSMLVALSGSAQVISALPFTEDFESGPTCGTGCGAACPTLVNFTNVTSDNLDWLTDVGGTSSSQTGPSVDHTTGTSAGQYVFVETSCNGTGYPSRSAILESPWFDFSGQTGLVSLEFWYHAFGQTQGVLDVEGRVGSAGPWIPIATGINDNVDLWQQWEGCIGPDFDMMDSVQFRWSYVSGSSFTGDIALDDITVSIIPPQDFALTALQLPTGCDLSSSEPVSFTVCNNGSSDLMPGTTFMVSVSVDSAAPVVESFTLTDTLLNVCNGATCESFTFATLFDFSAIGPHTANAVVIFGPDPVALNDSASAMGQNLPLGGTLPYIANFDSGQQGWVIDQLISTANSSWAFGIPNKTDINSAATGDSAFVTGGLAGTYNAGENSYVISPCIDISSATGEEVIATKVWWSTEFSWDGANLSYSVDAGQTWTRLGNFGDPNNWYNDNSISGNPGGNQEGWTGDAGNGSNGWRCAQNALDSATLVNNDNITFRFGFGSDGSVQRQGFGFDDFAIGLPITYDGLPDSILAICDVEYTLDGGPGYEFYRWDNGVRTQTRTVTSSGNYILTVSDSTGMCASDTVYVELLQFAAPDLQDFTTCVGSGDTAMFDAGPLSNPGTYLWSTGDSTQTSILPNLGQISVMKVDTVTGCFGSDTAFHVNNVEIDIADFGFCAGDTAYIDATTANGSYLWSTGDSTAMISTTTTALFTVMVTDTVLGCMSSDSVLVTQNPNPVVDLGPDQVVCDMATLDATTPGVSYLWSTGETTATITVTTSGDYWVVVSDLVTGCTGTDTVNVVVNISPSLDLGADTANCVSHVIDGTGTGVSYLWSTGDTTATITVTTTGNYSLTVTDLVTGCFSTDDINVTINALPALQLPADTTNCDAYTINSNLTSGVSYAWSTGDTTSSITATTTGNYTLTVTDLATGCVASDDITVTINNSPILDLGIDIAVCDSTLVEASLAGVSYNWSTGDTTNGIWVNASGTYTLTVTDVVTGCSTTDDIDVTVSATPALDLGADVTACDALLVDATIAGVSYLWSTGDTTATLNITSSGDYALTIADLTSACFATDSITVTINASPVVDLGADQDVCDTLVTFTLDAGAGVSYLWNDNSTNQTLDATASGTYSVTVTGNNGCTGTDDITLTFISCGVGIETIANSDEISLYPNPSNGNIAITVSQALQNGTTYKIVNLYGQVVKTGQLNSELTNFDLTDLASGNYFIQIEATDALHTKKFIIQQ